MIKRRAEYAWGFLARKAETEECTALYLLSNCILILLHCGPAICWSFAEYTFQSFCMAHNHVVSHLIPHDFLATICSPSHCSWSLKTEVTSKTYASLRKIWGIQAYSVYCMTHKNFNVMLMGSSNCLLIWHMMCYKQQYDALSSINFSPYRASCFL